MIKAVLFNEYRSIKGPARIDFNNITLLCGPNSAGKSSLLKVLDFFKTLSSGEHKPMNTEGSPARVLDSGEVYAEKMVIGIEFTTDSIITNRKRESEYQDRYISVGWDHAELWDIFAGKVIKIIVKCGGTNLDEDLFELFIDNILVMQIDNELTFYNHYFKTEDVDEAFRDSCRELSGNVKIHDSLISTYLTVLEESKFDVEPVSRSPLEKLFREKKDVWSTIRGLRFHYLSNKINYDHNLISPNYSITDLFDDNDDLIRWAVDTSVESYADESISKEDYIKWLRENDVIDIKNELEQLFNGLWDEADKLKCFLEGLFIRLEAALEFEHVSGSRAIVFSERPFHVDHGLGKAGKLEYDYQDKHISSYLSSWWCRQQKLLSSHDAKNQEQYDIVQLGFSKLMPSLGGYSFAPQVYELNDITSKINLSIKLNSDGRAFESIASGVLVYPYVSSNSSPSHLLNFRDVGSGLSFMLPIFSCLDTNNLSLIEQPELHLHPRAQCELGDVFIYASSFNHKSVVETHSEHLILRLSRRIRETTKGILLKNELKLKPNDVSIHYFKPDGQGKTTIHKIRFDSHGDFLDLWPDGFFAERNSELFDE